MWYFLRSIKNYLEFYFEQFFHGEETLRIENTGPVVVLESGVYGKFSAQPVKRYEVRSKSGRVDRVSSGYILEKPWPASRMIEMSDGFLAGDNEQDAVNHLHSLINLEKDIDRDIGRPL